MGSEAAALVRDATDLVGLVEEVTHIKRAGSAASVMATHPEAAQLDTRRRHPTTRRRDDTTRRTMVRSVPVTERWPPARRTEQAYRDRLMRLMKRV